MLTTPEKFYFDKISLHAPVTFESALHIVNVYFDFTDDQTSKIYLCAIHECAL